MKESSVRASYLMVAVAACMWGTWRFVLLQAERYAVAPLDARVEGAVVMLVMTILAFGFLAFTHRNPARGTRTAVDWAFVAWLGVADALNVLLLFVAYGKTTVAIAVTTHYLAPILVAASAPLLLRERAQRGTWPAVGLGFAGLALLLRPWSAELAIADALGAAAGAGSALFYASNVIVNKRLVGKFSAIELMAFHGVVATPLLAALMPAHGLAALNLPSTLILVGGGLFPGALGGILFIRALRRVRAAYASTITLLEPLVAVTIAVVGYSERLPIVSWVGGAIILLSAASVMQRGAT